MLPEWPTQALDQQAQSLQASGTVVGDRKLNPSRFKKRRAFFLKSYFRTSTFRPLFSIYT